MNRLEGKVAFITGGARGQGREIATKFASEGADIILCDMCADLPTVAYPLGTKEDLNETVRLVEAEGRKCVSAIADVRDQAALDAVVDLGIESFGHIDIAIANAGIVDFAPIWEITEQEWADQIDINLSGVWRTIKAVAPHMISRLSGSMVLTSSNNGAEGGVNYAHYIAAKHGVIGLMRSAALELGPHNIRVNAVLPGPCDTIMNNNPVGWARIAGKDGATREEYLDSVRNWQLLRGRTAMHPKAIANAMIWLVSDEASEVTGIELPVDTGHLALPGMNPAPIVEG
jgi:SDR family mycofactocin-dependent oxidoreductase